MSFAVKETQVGRRSPRAYGSGIKIDNAGTGGGGERGLGVTWTQKISYFRQKLAVDREILLRKCGRRAQLDRRTKADSPLRPRSKL